MKKSRVAWQNKTLRHGFTKGASHMSRPIQRYKSFCALLTALSLLWAAAAVSQAAPSRKVSVDQLNAGLIAAAANNDVSGIREAIEKGATPDVMDPEGTTPLMFAALRGDRELAEFLLEHGANINAKDMFGATPLMHAVWHGQAELAEFLLNQGADVNLRSSEELSRVQHKGVTALMAACMQGDTGMVALLVRGNANLDQRDSEGKTALMYAVRGGFTDIAHYLISEGANVEARDQYGRTALIVATMHGSRDAVRMLIIAGANVYARDVGNLDAMTHASALKQDNIHRMLKGYTAYLETRGARRF